MTQKNESIITKLAPSEAVRAYCSQRIGMKKYEAEAVRGCQGDAIGCPFFPHRLGKRPSVKVFRAFCIDCMNGGSESVKECPTKGCECFPYRMGINPARQGSKLRGIVLRKKSDKGVVSRAFCRQESVFLS